ncbi:MAG: hypothetical protein AAF649_03495 [Verrucomicrobiota bacterium]
MTQCSGLTRVEVVVLIFICGLFIGVSVPVYTMWTDRMHDAQCKHNLLAIGNALNAYGTDHQGVWPSLAAERMTRSQQVPVLDVVLAPYASSSNIFECPGDDNEVFQRTGSSYRWDFYPQAMKQQQGGIPDLSTATFRVESRPILLHQAIVLDKEPFHKSNSHANGLYLSR